MRIYRYTVVYNTSGGTMSVDVFLTKKDANNVEVITAARDKLAKEMQVDALPDTFTNFRVVSL